MFKKSLLFMMLLALFGVTRAQSDLTIYEDGSATSSYVPVYGLWADAYLKCEFVVSADLLGEMSGGTISEMTYHITTPATAAWTGTFKVFLKEIDDTTINDFTGYSDATSVYEGQLDGTASTMTIPFSQNYTYGGGNLLVGFYQIEKGSYKGITFQGETVNGASVQGYNSNSLDAISPTQRNFVPKTTFVYTPGGGPVCEKPATLAVSDITGYGATCTWGSTGAASYTFEWKKTSETDWHVVSNLTTTSYTLSNLEPYSNYSVRVKAICGTDLESGYRSASFTTLDVCPDDMVCIGEGEATHTSLPLNNYYKHSFTQQIYTADEISTDGAILSVGFYKNNTVSCVRTIDIYMLYTDKISFESTSDWIAVTASDMVFSGEITFENNDWTYITFDNPFIYNGRDNVALVVNDKTGSYVSSTTFLAFTAEGQSLFAQRDGTDIYDPESLPAGTVGAMKSRVRFAIGEPPACPKPTGLTVNYEGGTTATVIWSGDAASYELDVNGTTYTSNTNTYSLSNLELATTYEVKVRANCGSDGYSEWTYPVSFTTDICMPENKCALTFEVTDSYGDGWNGASIDIYDYTGGEVGDLLASISNQNLDGLSGSTQTEPETQTITHSFCDGQELAIIWMSGNYDGEASYTITDLNGDVVVEGEGEGFDGFAYTISCIVTDCRTPSNFTASEIANHSVVLSWTENGPATEWEIAYISENDEEISYITTTQNPYTLTGLTPETNYAAQVTPVCEVEKPSDVIYWKTDVACPNPSNLIATPYPTTANVTWNGFADAYEIEWAQVPTAESKDGLWLQYDNGTYQGGIGNSSANTWTWGVMYPASMLEGNGLLSKVSIYENSTYNTADITINIYSGGDDAPETLVYTETVTPEAADAFHEITLADIVTVDPSQNLWITLTEYGTYVLSYCSNGDNANNDWVNNGGTWAHVGDLSSSLAGDTWMIRGYVEPAFDPSTLDWTTVSGVTSPYTITGLHPETYYIARVKALCGGEDGESNWTTVFFTTPSACDMPIDLAAEVSFTSANLSWTGYQESYNLRYRQSVTADPSTPATIILEAHDVWEDGSGYQMLLDADATAYGVLWNENHYILVDGETYSGGDLPETYYSEFEYKIPEGADGSLSTTNIVMDGSVTITIPAGTYDFVILNPSPDENYNRFYIAGGNGEVGTAEDDFVFEPGVTYHFTMQKFGTGDGAAFEVTYEWSDWTTVEDVTNPYAFTGLTTGTHYEWQIQGVNASCGTLAWTEIQNFTTPTPFQKLAMVAGSNWCSSNIEITLDALKAAIVAAIPAGTTITINSKTQYTTYTGSTWRGTLRNLDLSQMFKVTTDNAFEITVRGEFIDPAAHPVTIKKGANWIAFPFIENMTVANAFAGFAVRNDMVNSKTKYTTYTGAMWRGTFTELEPGQGYVYKSAANTTRTFTYPASKSAPKAMTPATPKMPKAKDVLSRQIKTKTLDLELITPTRK